MSADARPCQICRATANVDDRRMTIAACCLARYQKLKHHQSIVPVSPFLQRQFLSGLHRENLLMRSYCTQLVPGTPSERVRMALMRHRDPKQTAKTYTDARMLPLKEAIAKLNFHRSPGPSKDDTQLDTQNSVAAGQYGSFAVTPPLTGKC
jgi:hypothetical protein